MPDANAAQIKESVRALTLTHDFNTKYKNLAGKSVFDAFFKQLNVDLEKKGIDAAKEDLVKSVIKQDFKDKFAFGKPEQIGGTPLTSVKMLVTGPPLPPQYTDLTAAWKANDVAYSKVRADVARVLGIDDKTHKQHGSNFSGEQTLKQIILNVTAKVEGKTEVPRVKQAVKLWYKFDL